MKDIILRKFPLIPKEIVMEIEIFIHYMIVEHEEEFTRVERIVAYLYGIFSALYMAGFIDGAHHCNDSCIVTSMVEDFMLEAYKFYRGN